MHHVLTAITLQLAQETSTLSEIVTAARGGIVHTSLITPQYMVSTLSEIKHGLKSTLSIPMASDISKLYELEKITKISVFYQNEQLIFITKIPLITDTELTLYNVIPMPIINNIIDEINTHITLETEYPYVAITKDRKHFTTYTEPQLAMCKDTSTYKICLISRPLGENSENQPCEIKLFNKPENIPTKCVPRLMNLKRNIYHKLTYQNAWLYAVNTDTITITCTDISEPYIAKISGQAKLSIKDPKCEIYTVNTILTAVDELLN